MVDDALGEHPDRSRADLVESRGGWAAMRADAAVALINGTARADSIAATDVEVIVEADNDHCCALSESSPSGPDNASAEAVELDDGGVNFVAEGRAVALSVGKRLCCDPRIAALVEDSRGTGW